MLECPVNSNYSICPSTGRVYSHVYDRWLRPSLTSGYKQVVLGGKHYYVHQLVAIAFYGDQKPLTVDHIDGNRLNNAWWNLQWMTGRDNSRKALVGKPSKNRDQTVYRWVHKDGSVFIGTRFDFANHIEGNPGGITQIVKGTRPTYKGWALK